MLAVIQADIMLKTVKNFYITSLPTDRIASVFLLLNCYDL